MKNSLKTLRFVGFVLMLTVILSACGTSSEEGDTGNTKSETTEENGGEEGKELGDENIELSYTAWSSCEASTNVVKAVLEDLGYEVEITQASEGPMFAGVADGTVDGMTCAWLPNNGVEQWDEYKEQLNLVNTNFEEAPIGLVVPEYMEDINSIEDLKGNEELGEATDWTIVGNEPGVGNTTLTEEAIEKYELDNWQLVTSSEATMLGVLQGEYKEENPVITTLWKPHYAFGQWDLKLLDDPKGAYGDTDYINTLARKGLEDDSPAAHSVLSNFKWNSELMNEVMVKIDVEDMDPEEAAKQFVEEHQDLVEEWTSEVKG